MKKIFSLIFTFIFAVIMPISTFAAEPGAIESWGCEITNFFDSTNKDTTLTVVYQNSTSNPRGNNIGFKINQIDWDEQNAIYPFFASTGANAEGKITFTITRDEIIAAASKLHGKDVKMSDILWADVRPADNSGAKVLSVTYSNPNGEVEETTTAATTETTTKETTEATTSEEETTEQTNVEETSAEETTTEKTTAEETTTKETTAEETTANDDVTEAAATAADTDDSNSTGFPVFIIVIVAAVVVIGVIVLLVIGRRRRFY